MKKLIFLLSIVLLCNFAEAQYYNCSTSRYNDSLFDVQISAPILYGSNLSYDGTPTNLNLKVYTPVGDTATKRPLIIFAPKGSFLSEDKDEWVMVQLCNYFAKRGFVCAAIDYRVGIDYLAAMANPPLEFTKNVIRAVHDYKAAIRYFRKDAATTNLYKIDTSMIIAGGSSAGAITALHVAFLNKISEFPSYIDTAGLGGLEGLSGNLGYSSKVKYVINLCGALADSSWLESGDIPIISMHGNLDTEVPYGKAMISMGINIMVVNGSAPIHQRALHVGVTNPFYTFWGRTHIPYDPNAAGSYVQYMDTVLNYVKTNLYGMLCNSYFSVEQNNIGKIKIYPNPTSSLLQLNFDKEYKDIDIDIVDISGKIVLHYNFARAYSEIKSIDISSLKQGLYIVKFNSTEGTFTKKLLVN